MFRTDIEGPLLLSIRDFEVIERFLQHNGYSSFKYTYTVNRANHTVISAAELIDSMEIYCLTSIDNLTLNASNNATSISVNVKSKGFSSVSTTAADAETESINDILVRYLKRHTRLKMQKLFEHFGIWKYIVVQLCLAVLIGLFLAYCSGAEGMAFWHRFSAYFNLTAEIITLFLMCYLFTPLFRTKVVLKESNFNWSILTEAWPLVSAAMQPILDLLLGR